MGAKNRVSKNLSAGGRMFRRRLENSSAALKKLADLIARIYDIFHRKVSLSITYSLPDAAGK